MIDSLIGARALVRLGPFARAVLPEGRSRGAAEELERRSGYAGQDYVPSRDPVAHAARAAFTIWATEMARATDARAKRESGQEGSPASEVRR